MSMQDRDYYREHHAEKNGLVYDRVKGVYRRISPASPRFSSSNSKPSRWLSAFWLWLQISVCVYMALKLIVWLARHAFA